MPPALSGLPDSVFTQEAAYPGVINTLGELAEGYITNTAALHRANNKIATICVAAKRCEKVDPK